MKIDVQGNELKVVLGAKLLFREGAVGEIQFKIAKPLLRGHGTTSKELCQTLFDFGFDLYIDDMFVSVDNYGNAMGISENNDNFNMFAKRR